MNYYLCILIFLQGMSATIIFEFNNEADSQKWTIVNDDVMGGRSSSQMNINSAGYGVFEGEVSLENNGGFSSVRYQFEKIKTTGYKKIKIRLKGDGKKYQFRVKNKLSTYYSYISSFSTTNEWQEIEIPLKDMYPSFRGRVLDQPNFSHEFIEQVTFLIANKRNERFKLVIDRIELI